MRREQPIQLSQPLAPFFSGTMNNSQLAPIQATVDAYKANKILGYGDIFNIKSDALSR